MHTFRFSCLIGAACTTCACLCAAAQGPVAEGPNGGGPDVLEKLKDFDSLFEAGFTVSATRQTRDTILRGRMNLEVKRKWRLTFGEGRVGYVMEALDYERPKYQPPKRRAESADGKAMKDDTLRISVRTKQWGYWGHDLSGNHYKDTLLEVTPEGEVTEAGEAYNSSLFGPREAGPNAPKRVMLWSLGRFFSKHLSKVTEVRAGADGRVAVSARGQLGAGESGRWELEIEPAAAWMVRTARFYWDIAPGDISVEMKNRGTVWSKSYCIPTDAVCNYVGPIGGPKGGDEFLTFEPEIENFDEKLYRDTQMAVAHNRTPTLTVHDYRVSPLTITEPNKPQPEPPAPPPAASVSRRWLFFTNLAVSVVLFVLLAYRRIRGWLRSNPADAAPPPPVS